MDGFVVRIALRQQVPLRTGVQNPEHGLQDGAGGDGLTPRSGIGNVLFGKMFSDPVLLVITQTEHGRTYRDRWAGRQQF